jgi:DNA-binding NarL/FixJ family response regulator
MTDFDSPVHIVIADDHALVRGGMDVLVKSVIPNVQTSQSYDFSTTIKLLEELKNVDILLLDLLMPGMNSIESVKYICKKWKDLSVIIVSAKEDNNLIKDILQAGAVGYIPKMCSPELMINAIRLVISGGIYIPSSILNISNEFKNDFQIKPNLNENIDKKKNKLTKRQKQIISLIRAGKSNQAIALDLDLAIGTIKMHISRMFKQLGVNSRTEALAKMKNDE